MAKKEVEERELTGEEVAVAVIIMLIALWILGDATEVYRIIISFVIMIGDLVLMYQAMYDTKKGE